MRYLRGLARLGLGSTLALTLSGPPVLAQIPDVNTGRVPTLAPLVKEVTPSVVNISVQGRVREDNPLYQDPFFREFFDVPKQLEKEINATGSGVIVDAQRGYVLTANHVVANATAVQIRTKDGRKFAGRVVGRDAPTDIALLQVKGPVGLKAIALGDSDALQVGDFVIAVGNPFGLGQTVTSGLVSALGRTGLGKHGYEDFIQTDAAINPGNSGGGLINLRGELVGINTAIISPGGGNVGIGFAVPINMARKVMEQLAQTGRVERGRIGVALEDLEAPAAGVTQGARVKEVSPGSPAERAGLRRGDIILKANEIPIRSATQMRNLIGLTAVGQQVRLTIERERATESATVEVAPLAEPKPRGRGPG
ncbi:serine protease Do [Bradyrhizobium sp. USDA 4518]|uniref:trypsin-like peptidase domain-containing protein n=1 Tax=Bradyrhizobium brasilense TaxID=1419277 RepID=UPI000975D1FC|nr:trypsin-like peptidase domain-containing protein [Bradyrhizobium brasilense]NLS69077.1 trypsin-like serine protease [Bradyrhizobium brasilense]OMI08756.1 peptidase [Bradyrhizobium brasilense]